MTFKALAAAAARVCTLKSTQLSRYHDRQQFFEDALGTAMILGTGKGIPTAGLAHRIMSTHVSAFGKLLEEQQLKREQRAMATRGKRQCENDDLIALSQGKISRLPNKLATSTQCPSRGCMVTSRKLGHTDLEEFATICNLPE